MVGGLALAATVTLTGPLSGVAQAVGPPSPVTSGFGGSLDALPADVISQTVSGALADVGGSVVTDAGAAAIGVPVVDVTLPALALFYGSYKATYSLLDWSLGGGTDYYHGYNGFGYTDQCEDPRDAPDSSGHFDGVCLTVPDRIYWKVSETYYCSTIDLTTGTFSDSSPVALGNFYGQQAEHTAEETVAVAHGWQRNTALDVYRSGTATNAIGYFDPSNGDAIPQLVYPSCQDGQPAGSVGMLVGVTARVDAPCFDPGPWTAAGNTYTDVPGHGSLCTAGPGRMSVPLRSYSVNETQLGKYIKCVTSTSDDPCRLRVVTPTGHVCFASTDARCQGWWNTSTDTARPGFGCVFASGTVAYTVGANACKPLASAYGTGTPESTAPDPTTAPDPATDPYRGPAPLPSPAPDPASDPQPYTPGDPGPDPSGSASPSPGGGIEPTQGGARGTDPGTVTLPVTPGTSCFPSGWDAFNPLQWIYEPVLCALRDAFVPSSSQMQSVTDLKTDVLNRAPFSYVGDVVGWLPQLFTGTVGCLTWDVHLGSLGAFRILHTCESGPIEDQLHRFRPLMEVAIYVGFLGPLAWWAWKTYAPGSTGTA